MKRKFAVVAILAMLTGCSGGAETAGLPPASKTSSVRSPQSVLPPPATTHKYIYVADGANNRIAIFPPNATDATQPAYLYAPLRSLAALNFPRALAVDGPWLIVANSGMGTHPGVLRFPTGASGAQAALRYPYTFANPVSIAVNPKDGSIAVFDQGVGRITVINGDPNVTQILSTITLAPPFASALSDQNSTQIAYDSQGHLYFPWFGSNAVLVLPQGASGIVSPLASWQVPYPTAVATDSSDNVYVSTYNPDPLVPDSTPFYEFDPFVFGVQAQYLRQPQSSFYKFVTGLYVDDTQKQFGFETVWTSSGNPAVTPSSAFVNRTDDIYSADGREFGYSWLSWATGITSY